MNRGKYNIEPLPNETKEEYQSRIRKDILLNWENSDANYNTQLNERFQKRLREIIPKEAIINNLSQSLTTEDKFIVIQQFNLFKTGFIKIYGEKNQDLTTSAVNEYTQKFLKKLEREANVKSIEAITKTQPQTPPKTLQKSSTINAKNLTPYDLNDFNEPNFSVLSPEVVQRNKRGENFNDDRSTYIYKGSYGSELYFKVAKHKGVSVLLYSFTGEPNTFKQYLENKLGSHTMKSSDEIYDRTGIDKKELARHFGVSSPSYIPQALAGKINITKNTTVSEYQNADDETKQRVGAGLEDIPKTADFGSKKIIYNKLYYHNILSLKYKNGINVKTFNNIKISDKLRSIIINLVQGYKPTTTEINTLSKTEQELYDRLIYLSNLNKSVENTQDKTVNNLKKRLEIISGEIQAGNNNPTLKTELKSILEKLTNFKVISKKSMTDYLKQF